MTQKIFVETKTATLFSEQEPFIFECGASLPEITVAYETYGELNPAGDNAVFINHALTGNAHAAFYNSTDDKIPGWWDGFVGNGKPIDPAEYFIVCANLLSSCYGTTGPTSINPKTGRTFGMDFPPTTTRDMVRVNKALLDYLGVKKLACVTGGSLGAMQVWEWIVQYPDFVEKAVNIAGTAKGSPWMIALNEVARQAIYNDPKWNNGKGEFTQPELGLKLARMIAMITYRSQAQFWQRYARERVDESSERYFNFDNWFQIESYLHYQGTKLVERFDARTYIYLTKAMDLHDISRGFDSWESALKRIRASVLSVGISSDVLYFREELIELTRQLRELGINASYREIDSIFGHDSFLIEYDKLNPIVRAFLRQH
ncbi:homoserine O-acetyltransferase [candidate division KSB1 bacterium]|nr:homoserine O-acetyltransferase [candidate division KSB1 bacterium]